MASFWRLEYEANNFARHAIKGSYGQYLFFSTAEEAMAEARKRSRERNFPLQNYQAVIDYGECTIPDCERCKRVEAQEPRFEEPATQPEPKGKVIYLIGSLRNPEVPVFAEQLRAAGFEVFDDWYAAGPEADDRWRDYEKGRGHSFIEALDGHAANHVYHYDRSHLDRADAAVLLLPAGKSGHLELGYIMGAGKPGYIVLGDEPERFDVMYRFANQVFNHKGLDKLVEQLRSDLCVSTAAR